MKDLSWTSYFFRKPTTKLKNIVTKQTRRFAELVLENYVIGYIISLESSTEILE